MYKFKRNNDVITFTEGKVYKSLHATYFMFFQPGATGIFGRILNSKELVGEDKLYPEGYVTIDDKEYPVIIISKKLKSFKEADAAISSYSVVFEALKLLCDEPSDVEQPKNTVPKAIAYNYMFNYFGGDTYDGKIIDGASIDLVIRPYRGNKELKFLDETDACFKQEGSNYSDNLSNVFSVSFDRKDIFKVSRNITNYFLLTQLLNCERIDYEVVGYSLTYLESEYMSADMSVSEEVFRQFIKEHLDDFDISDNVNAQCPAVSMI